MESIRSEVSFSDGWNDLDGIDRMRKFNGCSGHDWHDGKERGKDTVVLGD